MVTGMSWAGNKQNRPFTGNTIQLGVGSSVPDCPWVLKSQPLKGLVCQDDGVLWGGILKDVLFLLSCFAKADATSWGHLKQPCREVPVASCQQPTKTDQACDETSWENNLQLYQAWRRLRQPCSHVNFKFTILAAATQPCNCRFLLQSLYGIVHVYH